MLKRILMFVVLVLVCLFFSFQTVKAVEQINSFETDIVINSDSSLRITETIEYNFGTAQKHGIYRDIIYKYNRQGSNFKFRISDIEVSDENGLFYKFVVLTHDKYIQIKIGDANKYVTGKKIYKIGYTVRRAINYFSDHDELYWNATGNEWQMPIISSSATVHLPDEFSSGQIQFTCYSGSTGSTKKCSNSNFLINNAGFGKTVNFSHTALGSYEGLTIVVGIPVGILSKPKFTENVWLFLQDNYVLFLPLLVLIIMVYLWRTRGRDSEGQGTIITQFDAHDDLSPLEVGTLVDEKASNKDLSAQLIYLATLGYLDITKVENKKDYILKKKKDLPEQEKEFNHTLFKELFSEGKDQVQLSTLKYEFASTAGEIKSQVYNSLEKDGYFVDNPNKIRNAYIAVAITFWMISIFFAVKLQSVPLAVSAIISSLIIAIFGFFMPSRTKKGVLAREHIFGLKNYLNVAEKDRINFHNAPEKEPKLFEKLLPFAMVLGVEKVWAKQFEGIYNQEPSWYHGQSGSFSAIALSQSLSDFGSSTTNNLTATNSGSSGMGGGGFSGGGGGGGGGGSW